MDLGDLSYYKNSTTFYSANHQGKIQSPSTGQAAKVLSTFTNTISDTAVVSGTIGLAIGTDGYIYIRTTEEYSDANAFKTAMKGKLLAYLKAGS